MQLVVFLLPACTTPVTLEAEDPSDPSPTSPTSPTDGTEGPVPTPPDTTSTSGSPSSTTDPTGSTTDSTSTTTDPTTPPTGAYVPADPSLLGPGLAWVRTNRPFISGLTVSMGAPPSSEVDRYFDDFHATAAHLWLTGLPDEVAAWEAVGHPDFRWVTWTDADGTNPITGIGVGDLPVTPSRIGCQIWDEPRPMDELLPMQVGSDRVRTHDPDALFIDNFGNADEPWTEEELIEHALEHMDVDVIAYDLHTLGHSELERANLLREYGLAYGVPYWRFLNSFGDVDGRDILDDEEDLRWSALVGLVYGYTGHTWFLYDTDATTAAVVYTSLFDDITTWNHTPNFRFDIIAELNLLLEGYAETTDMLTRTDVRYEPYTVLYSPDGHDTWAPGAGDDPYTVSFRTLDVGALETQEWSIGTFVDNHDELYMMVQNANHPGIDYPLYRPEGTFELVFDFASAPSNVDRTRIEKLAPPHRLRRRRAADLGGGHTGLCRDDARGRRRGAVEVRDRCPLRATALIPCCPWGPRCRSSDARRLQ